MMIRGQGRDHCGASCWLLCSPSHRDFASSGAAANRHTVTGCTQPLLPPVCNDSLDPVCRVPSRIPQPPCSMSASSSPSTVGLFQSQRFLPGTSRAEMEAFDAAIRGAPEPPQFESFQGTFATQEYLQATISQN